MTHPNVTLRRHRSFDSSPPSRSRTFLLHGRRERHSPHLGWFRHAPPRTLPACLDTAHKNTLFVDHSLCKSSPYVGFLRHAPPTQYAQHVLIEHSSQETTKVGSETLTEIDFISGYLRGGGGADDWRHSAISPVSNGRTSSSLPQSLLSCLRYWLLGEQEDTFSCIQAHITGQRSHRSKDHKMRALISADYTRAVDDYDNYDTTLGSALRSDDTLSVSSLAEAYYNQQAHKELDCSDTSEGHRLDYVITQVDILRMTRNASRHLDVTSILALPTITYAPRAPADAEFSWRLVDHDGQEQDDDSHDKDVCVICLEHFRAKDTLRVLPCNHSFHTGCIDRWLSGSHSFVECDTTGCPTCKKTVQRVVHPPAWAFSAIGSALREEGSSLILSE